MPAAAYVRMATDHLEISPEIQLAEIRHLAKLVRNVRVAKFLSQHHPEFLEQFQAIADIASIKPADKAA